MSNDTLEAIGQKTKTGVKMEDMRMIDKIVFPRYVMGMRFLIGFYFSKSDV